MNSSRTATEAILVDSNAAVTLRAPGRLHLGFLDPAGSLGRRFGSLGLVIDGFETHIELSASPSQRVSASGLAERAEVERAAGYLHLLQRHSGLSDALHLSLLQVLPGHAGFGSGTQLALAIGRAFAQWHGLDASTSQLAQWLGRGLRSGIGIAGFDQGGLLVDGGPGVHGVPAPLLARIALPAAWRVLVVQDTARQGLSGADERQAIATLAPLPRALAADICHQVLMRVLPGAAGAEFAPFAAGISRIQQVLGEHFAPAQGGSAFTSAAVGRLIGWIARGAEPLAATGQSSWGPTGFAILPSQAQAEAVVDAARAANVVGSSLTLHIVAARNAGAAVVDQRRLPSAR
jgi:beta-ribofuranosylaminobenzene 5'-phosphate synthase